MRIFGICAKAIRERCIETPSRRVGLSAFAMHSFGPWRRSRRTLNPRRANQSGNSAQYQWEFSAYPQPCRNVIGCGRQIQSGTHRSLAMVEIFNTADPTLTKFVECFNPISDTSWYISASSTVTIYGINWSRVALNCPRPDRSFGTAVVGVLQGYSPYRWEMKNSIVGG